MTRPAACALLLLACLASGGLAGAEPPPEPADPEISRRDLKDLVRWFADDDLQGRESGTAACDRAADFIAAIFRREGLRPLDPDGTFFQPFTSPKGTKVLPTTALEAADGAGETRAFALAEDFAPLSVSAAGDVTGPLAFAGYGIAAPDMDYDDYAGLDVRGKVVVVLRHAPRWQDRRSPFASPEVMLRHASFKAKADAAAERGAVALLVANDPDSTKPRDDVVEPPGGSVTGRIPVMHLTWRAARKLGALVDLPFMRRQRAIDGRLTPRSEAVAGASIHVRCDLETEQRQMRNVVGLLEPAAAATTGEGGTAAPETVVIGAHYDHVGLGRFGSLANANGKIHNGADDNASGTSALLEIAGWLAARRGELRRRVLFVAFCGEELGLLGSKHYVRAPLLPLDGCVAMLNLDMVGRLHKERLYVGGTGTSPVWPELMDSLNRDLGRFDLTSWPGGKAPSDHTSFYEAGLPVLFFFTGLHEDYHRPSDDWDTIEYKGHERVTRFAAAVALDLATRPDRPAFTRCDAGGFDVGPYTGLAVEQREGGVFVAYVDKRSPADKARFEVGDRIVTWNGTAVPDTGRWNDLVSRSKPGEDVDVDVEREGRTRRLRLEMGKT